MKIHFLKCELSTYIYTASGKMDPIIRKFITTKIRKVSYLGSPDKVDFWVFDFPGNTGLKCEPKNLIHILVLIIKECDESAECYWYNKTMVESLIRKDGKNI